MWKKLVIVLVLTACVFGAIFFKLMAFDDAYLEKVNIETSFKKNIEKELRLVPLDYMNQREVDLCYKLQDILKNNYQKMVAKFPQNIAGSDELFKILNPSCDKEEFDKIFPSDDSYKYSFYKMDNEEILILVKTPGLLNFIASFIADECRIDEVVAQKSLIVSEKTMIVKIDNSDYLISEWFSPDKYVFYYLDKSRDYDGVICRFDVKND